MSDGRRAVLGLAGTVDYELTWDQGSLQRQIDLLGIEAAEVAEADGDAVATTPREMLIRLLRHLAAGDGGECAVGSTSAIVELASTGEHRITLGGTNIRAAAVMRLLGVDVTVHLVSTDENVRRLLPAGIGTVYGDRTDATYPHLIVQYPRGSRLRLGDVWLEAPRANRVIFAHDPPHAELRISQDLGMELAHASAFLISGVNVMSDVDLARRRMEELRAHLRRLPRGSVVYYEEAGFHHPEVHAIVHDGLRGAIEIAGLNEDELGVLLGRAIDLDDPAAVAGGIERVHDVTGAPTVVLHTSRWALAHGPDAGRYRDALRLGTAAAAARYLHGDAAGRADIRHILGALPESRSPLGRTVERRLGGHVAFVSAIDATETTDPTTIGLGDAFVGGFLAGVIGVESPS